MLSGFSATGIELWMKESLQMRGEEGSQERE